MIKTIFFIIAILFVNALQGQQMSEKAKNKLYSQVDVSKITYLWDGHHYKIQNRKYESGIADKEGNLIIDVKYHDVYPSRASGWVILEDQKYWFVDSVGKRLNNEYYEDTKFFNNGVAIVKQAGKYGMIDTLGKTVVPLKYEEIQVAHRFKDLKIVKLNGLFGVINSKNKTIIPFEYLSISDFVNELFCVNKNGKWGYIDEQNHVVISIKYDEAEQFSMFGAQLAAVKYEDQYGFINLDGKEVVPSEYEDVGSFSNDFEKDLIEKKSSFLAPVKKNGKWGYINESNQLIIPYQYKNADAFFENKAYVETDNDSFYIDVLGEKIE